MLAKLLALLCIENFFRNKMIMKVCGSLYILNFTSVCNFVLLITFCHIEQTREFLHMNQQGFLRAMFFSLSWLGPENIYLLSICLNVFKKFHLSQNRSIFVFLGVVEVFCSNPHWNKSYFGCLSSRRVVKYFNQSRYCNIAFVVVG